MPITVVPIPTRPLVVVPVGTGLQGRPGASGSAVNYLVYPASGPIGGNRVVRKTASGVEYVDPANLTHANTAIGLTMNAAADGDPVNVQIFGSMAEPSWNFTYGLPVFIGASGVPTQIPPTSGFIETIGVVESPTSLVIQLRQLIILE